MLKVELEERLEEAAGLLGRAQEDGLLPNGLKQDVGVFLEALAEEKEKDPPAKRLVWRIATVVNPETDRENTVEVTTGGFLHPKERDRVNVTRATSWVEVQAESRREAIALIRKGKGTRFVA